MSRIFGIGTDLCAVPRIEKSLGRPGFAGRVFAAQELALLETRQGPRRAQTAAANFAAKEAFLKACGTGLGGFALCELAVLRGQNGAPYFALQGAAARWAAENRIAARVSLSHDAGAAVAFVILEQE